MQHFHNTPCLAFDALTALQVQGKSIHDLAEPVSHNPYKDAIACGERISVHNFCVDDIHTYIADGYRVHNDSALHYLTGGEEFIDTIVDFNNGAPRVIGYTARVDDGFGIVTVTATEVEGTDTTEVTKAYTYRDDDGDLQLMQTDKVERDPVTGKDTVVSSDVHYLNLDGGRYGQEIATAFTPFLTRAFIGQNAHPLAEIGVSTAVSVLAGNAGEFVGLLLHHSLLEADTNGDVLARMAEETFQDIGQDFVQVGANTAISVMNRIIVAEIFEHVHVDGVTGAVLEAVTQNGLDWLVSSGLDVVLDGLFPGLGYQPMTFLANPVGLVATVMLQEALPQIQSLEGQITAAAVKAVLTTVFAAIGVPIGPLAPVVAFLAGYGIGALIDWFASLGPDPQAWANVDFDAVAQEFFVSESWTRGGGNVEIAENMAELYVDGMNWFASRANASSETYVNLDLPQMGYIQGRGAYNDGGGGVMYLREQDAVFEALFRGVDLTDQRDGNLPIARIVHNLNLQEKFRNAQEAAQYKWLQDALDEAIRTGAERMDVSVPTAAGALAFSVVIAPGSSPFHAYQAIMGAFAQALFDRDGLSAALNTLAEYGPLYQTLPGFGSSGVLHHIDGVQGLLDLIGRDWIYSYEELYQELISQVQIASDYQTYMENTAQINAVIRANPDAAWTAGWIATLAKAHELDLHLPYSVAASSRSGLISTADGADVIRTGSGVDVVKAYGGHDRILSSSGLKVIEAGGGNDLIETGTAAEHVRGETGFDTVQMTAMASGVVYQASGFANSGSAAGDTFLGVERFMLTNHSDVALGGAKNDDLFGLSGDDFLSTGSGDNTLTAGLGQDLVLVDGPGSHEVSLGGGADSVVVAAPGARVSISDFGQEDLLILAVDLDVDGLAGRVQWSDLSPFVQTMMDGTVIALPDQTRIELAGVDPADLFRGPGNASLAIVDASGYADALAVPVITSAGDGTALTEVAGPLAAGAAVLGADGLVRLGPATHGTTPTPMQVRRVLSLEDDFEHVGSALSVSDDLMILTSNAGSQRGIGNSISKVDFRKDFSLEMDLKWGENEAGGDGIAIVWHDDAWGAQAIGGDGHWLGSRGIKKGFGIEFDVYNNGGIDIAPDHTNFFDTDTRERLNEPTALANLEDTEWHSVAIHWDAEATRMWYTLDNVLVGELSTDVVALFLDGSPFAHLGISAATGRSSNAHAVRNVVYEGYFDTDPPAPDLAPDAFTVAEDQVLRGNLFAHNREGVDLDTDGALLTLLEVSGVPTQPDPALHNPAAPDEVPKAVVLPSGAMLSYYRNGDFVFDPGNGPHDFAQQPQIVEALRYTVVTTQGRTEQQSLTITVVESTADLFRHNHGSDVESLVHGTSNSEMLQGDAAANTILAYGGHDTVSGGGGSDHIAADLGDDLVEGGADADSLSGGAGQDVLSYAGSDSAVQVNLATGMAFGGDAAGDRFSGFEGVRGSSFADYLTGDALANVIEGGRGNDLLVGHHGDDLVDGGGGRDRLFGNAGSDTLMGGDGDDKLEGNLGADLLDGGAGARDMAEYYYAVEGVTVHLADSSRNSGADAAGDVLVGIEDVAGGRFNDVITGDAGVNALFGRLGDDTLDGGGARDWLDGSYGDDRLIFRDSDAGIGGFGADVFEFHRGGYQVVGIFHADEGDRLDISNLGFSSKTDFLDTAIDIFGLHTRFELGAGYNIQLNHTKLQTITEDQLILI